MNIFVTNDDGIESIGLKALVEALKDKGNIYLVAPDAQRSASSHSVTIHGDIRMFPVKYEGVKKAYACSGTPVDCVKVGMDILTKKKINIDLVISGINLGRNLGIDTFYSGTVACAREAFFNGIPSVAVSYANWEPKTLKPATKIIEKVVKVFPEIKGLGTDFFISINVPDLIEKEIKGIKCVKPRFGFYDEWFIERELETGEIIFDFTGAPKYKPSKNKDYDDVDAINDGYIAISPLTIYKSHDNHLKAIEPLL